MYVLDSSVLIDAIHHHKRFDAVAKILKSSPAVTASIALQEVLEGADEHQQKVIEQISQGMEVLSHDKESAQHGAKAARQMKSPVGKGDMLIAAVCLQHNATLVTADKGFSRVPGLKVLLI